MATTPPLSDESSGRTPAPAAVIDAPDNDPFRSTGPTHYRFSNFNAKLFALGPNASPAQAKRALEAHLAETDRRMEEAGKLGTALVQQRNELTERLKEVEKLQAEDELSDDLRQKLVGIEKDYNEVARESARAFLPKSRVPSNEAAAGSPFVPEGKRSVSPSKFEAQATASPTKLSVPNRKIRNQPSNRIHDIEFAAEISSSLIVQVRNLQGLLAEKEEELKETRSARSKLEYDAETLQQRLKALDDNEHRYKDENWNLETKIHELMAENKDTADRVKKLTQSLNILQSEKNASQRELDEIKLSHSKLTEEHAATVKHHDIELGTAKRTMVMAESEKAAMQRKIEDLTGQNSDLAKAMSVSMRAKKSERESIVGMSDEDFHTAHDHTTPEDSPPASPIKGTPRHSMLESETLKTSLAHAQRLIQSLRTNVHREKTEKIESRRLLQEARDEIEKLRSEPIVPTTRRSRKADKEFKKPPRLLGSLRSARSEIFLDDPDWEDQPDVLPHPLSSPVSRETTMFNPVPEQTDHFETANETSDAAFETANENATETDDFHTGAEEFSSDDAETETESPSKRRTLTRRPPNLFGIQRHGSIDSTASTEDEDFPYEEVKTPTLPPLHAKFPLRVSRGAYRRSRQTSEEPALPSSPVSFANSSNMGTPQQPAQSLAAELGDFDGSDNESSMSATPSRRSVRGRAMTPPPALPPLPRAIMVDSGMMTEPVHESSASPAGTVVSRFSVGSDYNDSVNHDVGEKLAAFPTPPSSSHRRDFALVPSLALSTVHSHNVEPLPEPDTHGAEMAGLRAEHAEQLKNLVAENASTQAAAIEILNKAAAVTQASHDKELESLGILHVQQLAQKESETLKSSHSEELSRRELETTAAHAAELEALKVAHTEELARREDENKSARDAEINGLKAAYAEEISRKEAELKAAAAAELEALKLTHAEELSRFKNENDAVHAAELAALSDLSEANARQLKDLKSSHADQIDHVKHLKSSHLQHIDEIKSSIEATHAEELESLRTAHAQQLTETKNEITAAQTTTIASLTDSHSKQLDEAKNSLHAVHSQELESLRATHSQELESLKATHSRQVDDLSREKEAAHTAAIVALAESHSQHINETKDGMAATHAQELGRLRASHIEQLDELRKEKDSAHAAALAAMVGTHTKQLETQRADGEAAMSREIIALKTMHAQEIETLNHQHAAAHAKELDAFKAALAKQVESSKTEGDAAHYQQIEALNAAHAEIIEVHKRDAEIAQSQALESLRSSHERQIDTLRSEHSSSRAKELELDLKDENAASRTAELEDLTNKHRDELKALRDEHEVSKSHLREELGITHSAELVALRAKYANDLAALKKLTDSHSQRIADLDQESEQAKFKELAALMKADHEADLARKIQEMADSHAHDLKELRQQGDSDRSQKQELANLDAAHTTLEQASKNLDERDASQSEALDKLGAEHSRQLDQLKMERDATLARELDALRAHHAEILDSQTRESDAALARELNTIKAQHAQTLESQAQESTATLARALDTLKAQHAQESEQLKAHHAQILESYIRETAAEKEALLASHAAELEALRASLTIVQPTLGYSSMSSSPRREAFIIPRDGEPSKAIDIPIIAEDDTQITTNTDARLSRKLTTNTSHQGSQTHQQSQGAAVVSKGEEVGGALEATPSTIRIRRSSTDSLGSPGSAAASEPFPTRRPGSAASVPIEAARSNSAHGAKGSMGPPLLPASANKPSQSPASVIRATPTPRAGRTPGYADVHSPTRMPMRSRQSSISSFASEIDTRFNIHNGMGIDPSGFGPSTDPRMIQAVTQTMIGEYLWKYTRKTGRGEMSENRHRRFFWVHPYTRALYWSDSDPGTGSREMRAKSVPIEAVRVVADDNPMPPGLHRKSLIVIAPGRTIKFTCTTGQRHETWFNALSYLLLRSGNENKQDAEEVAGNITLEDVDEFNPSAHRRPENGQRPQPPPSLSSYNSRTTRNESPSLEATMSIPTLTPTREKEAARTGTFGRLSGYWRSSSLNRGTFGSLRSRSYQPYDSAIYEASEVPDSAEDLRQIIEQQDRESDRLENVRACCDGKHDVGTLSYTSKRGRLPNFQSNSHTHTHPGPSGSQSATGSTRSRA
ncbi:hypothetical protein F5X98DRAFT_362387 [Xylaria grammica]|nr:hypothetical protein F5X98DRAFT_362387 [Xylaria grammica]